MIKFIARKSMANMLVRIIGSIFSLFMSAYIARNYSLFNAGEFFLMVSYIAIFSTIANFGLNNELLRQASQLFSSNLLGKLSELFTSCVITMLSISALIITILYFLELPFTSYILLMSIPFISIITFCGIFLQSSGAVVKSSLVQFVFLPLIMLINLVIFSNYLEVQNLYFVSVIITSCVSLYYVAKVLKFNIRFKYKLTTPTKSLIAFQIILVLNQNIGMIVLDLLNETENIAVFAIAKKVTMLLGFCISAVNSVVAPKLASAFAKGDMKELNHIVKSSSRLLIGFAIPASLIIFIFPKEILSVFGEGYSTPKAVDILLILAFGQLINIVTGTVAYLLIVTKNEYTHLLNLIIAISISIFIYIFIYTNGVHAVAILVASILIIHNLLSWYSCLKILKINTLKI